MWIVESFDDEGCWEQHEFRYWSEAEAYIEWCLSQDHNGIHYFRVQE